jgi:hypothetical protein
LNHPLKIKNWVLATPLLAAGVLFFHTPGVAAASLPIAVTPTRLEFSAYPGDRVSGSISFWNGTDAFLPVHVEAGDVAQQDEEGHAEVGEVDAANSLKSWIKLALPDVNVAPKEKITLDFTIDVPVNADPGSHWGALLVTTAPAEQPNGTAVRTRTGTILLMNVIGVAREKLTLEGMSAPGFLQGPPLVIEARFRNEGTVHEKPKGVVEVRNMFGRIAASAALPERNVLPGTVRKIEASVGEGVWLGRYTATLRAKYGTGGQTINATVRFWAVPWKRYGPWVLAFIFFLAFVIWKRRNFGAFWYTLKTGLPPPQSNS